MHLLLRGDRLDVGQQGQGAVGFPGMAGWWQQGSPRNVAGYQTSWSMGEPGGVGCSPGGTHVVNLASQAQTSWKSSFISSTAHAFA